MEYNLDSSLGNENKKTEDIVEKAKSQYENQAFNNKDSLVTSTSSCRLIKPATATSTFKTASTQAKIPFEATSIRSPSPQVVQYYQKFSESSNLNEYLKLPILTNTTENAEYYDKFFELNHKCLPRNKKHEFLNSYIPKERKRWDRPPLVLQASIDEPTVYVKFDLTYPEDQQQEPHKEQFADGGETITTSEDKCIESSRNLQSESAIERKTSPTSSVASHKPLEWDSGADVGYLYEAGNQQRLNLSYQFQHLSTSERMALVRGCSTALRLDPEGTTEQQQQQSSIVVASALGKPDANSTPLLHSVSGSESEIEITPIVKSHPTGIVESDEHVSVKGQSNIKNAKDAIEIAKSSNSKFRVKVLPSTVVVNTSKYCINNDTAEGLPLKKSLSMNLISCPTAKLPLKRSQSEMNLCGKEKTALRLIFNSTSSIATVVNKPTTCNKLIQTRTFTQESVGVQVSVIKEEEKPLLPRRVTSLTSRKLNSILKNAKDICKIQNPNMSNVRVGLNAMEKNCNYQQENSSSNSLYDNSLIRQANNTENITGRTNSFDNFSGHIYENVPNGSTSHVSSVDTGCSNSTMPNTSSSVDEKLWGNSDSLIRDIERSVNILKSVVDANKLDKHVKKRLIHHVIKRLVNAKYTDDKIEHNLEENVPWNPADARNKVYRTEIIQALAKNTTESSEDWRPLQKKKNIKKSISANDSRIIKDIINIPAEMESSNSDKFDRNTDRTVMDGRKARMGLRVDDCDRHSSSNIPTNESSECFLPQRGHNKTKVKDMFITSTSNSSPQDQNRALLDAVVNSRRSLIDSSNEVGNSVDWRLPTTVSEHIYELRHPSNSDSGDIKLVSYAEMEKRNQLIWITNEISHLSNLKKLLEQPKIKSLPQKIKHQQQKTDSKQQKLTIPTYNHQIHNSNVNVADDNLLNRQWSSHCNLANCSSPMGTNTIKHLKKRNSCTQTATDYSSAYSRTGSEIVSARMQSPNIKLTNVYVQTPRLPSSTSKLYTDCPLHRIVPLNCTCSERICLFCKSKHLLQQRHLFTDDRYDVHNEAKFVCNDLEKETKNQINKTKLKCTCETNDKETDGQKTEKQKKSITSSQTSNQHQCKGSVCLCRKYKLSELPSGEFSRDCVCEDNKLIYDFEKMNVNQSFKKKLFVKATGTSYNCECKKTTEIQNKRMDCSYYSNKQVQPYYFLDSNKELNNSQNHCCVNKLKDQEKANPSSKHSMRTSNDSTASEYKYCRICGMFYQNEPNCECVLKSYPKPVAYELSFIDNNKINEPVFDKLELEIKSIKKKDAPTNVLSREDKNKSCICGGSQHTIKRCDCNHGKEQPYSFNSEKKKTLQDYLISNNPGFAENVETRRQYVSEIQRLRQLRKDRRVQLLAMATTITNVVTSPRPTKVTKCVKRKISDEDMKARLRKRYFQLSEVRTKRKQQQLQQETRCNKLMAKIFCKKLQQKVLRGQVDLSQSVSVISNL